jgi:hypothetical protein
MEVFSSVTPNLKQLALVSTVVIIVASAWLGWRRARPRDAASYSLLLMGTMAFLMASATVFSPQYMVWLIALAAVSATVVGRPMIVPLIVLGIACVLTHIVFPFLYGPLLRLDLVPALLLTIRNALVITVGVLAWRAFWNRRRDAYEPAELDARQVDAAAAH